MGVAFFSNFPMATFVWADSVDHTGFAQFSDAFFDATEGKSKCFSDFLRSYGWVGFHKLKNFYLTFYLTFYRTAFSLIFYPTFCLVFY